MKITIEIECDNAAFSGRDAGPEVARILRRVANVAEDSEDDAFPMLNGFFLSDSNGNRVGSVTVTP